MAEDNWIGGDFTGLQHMGSTLTGATKELEGVVKPLSSGADSLVHDAGWQGDAATSFRDAWTTDAMTAGGFSDLVGSVGSILTSLGTELSQLNDALHSASATAKGLGVPVNPDGTPGTMVTASPPDAAAQKATEALSDYGTVYASIKHQAQQARLQAAQALISLHDELDPSEPLANADKAVIGIVLRDLYASKDDHKSVLAEAANEEVDKARKARSAAKAALATERASFAAEGKWLPKNLSSYTEYRSSVSEYVKAQQALGAIEDSRNAFSRLVNFKAGDIEAMSKALSDFK